jgi:hypothetical protein
LTPFKFIFIFSRYARKYKYGNLKGVQGNWFPCRVWAEPKVFALFNAETFAAPLFAPHHLALDEFDETFETLWAFIRFFLVLNLEFVIAHYATKAAHTDNTSIFLFSEHRTTYYDIMIKRVWDLSQEGLPRGSMKYKLLNVYVI